MTESNQDLNFKVTPDWHQAIKIISALIGIPMKDLVLLLVDRCVKAFGGARIAAYLPSTQCWAPSSAERFDKFIDLNQYRRRNSDNDQAPTKRSSTTGGKMSDLARSNAMTQCLSELIDTQLQRGKSLEMHGREIGYENPKMLEWLRQGIFIVPLDKVLPLARALNADPPSLFRLALRQYWAPVDDETLDALLGRP